MKRCFELSRWSAGTSNANKWYRKFRLKRSNREKSNTLEGITFFRKISVGMNRSIYFPTGTTGFSIQMVSTPCDYYPASRGFSRASPFSMYIVVRVSGISRCRLVLRPPRENKPTTRNTRQCTTMYTLKDLR